MTVERIKTAPHSLAAERSQDITASVAGALLGVHPYWTAYKLWALKTARLSASLPNRAQQRGSLFEPIAVNLVRHQYPDLLIDYPLDAYWRDSVARMGASPDAFAMRPDIGRGVLQIKTISEDAWRQGWADPDTGDVVLPTWIAVQANVEADLTDAAFAAVAAIKVPRGLDDLVEGLVHSGCGNIEDVLTGVAFAWLALGRLEVNIIEVPIHVGVLRRLRAQIAEFWRVVEAGETPPPDWSRDGDTVLDVFRDSEDQMAILTEPAAFETLVSDYAAAKDAEGAAAKQAAELKPQIIAMLGNADRGETGRWRVFAKTQHRKAYTVRESSSRPLRVTDKAAAPKKKEFAA